MELRALIQQAEDIRQQRHALAQQDLQLRQQLEHIEAEIKKLADTDELNYENLSEQEFQLLLSELGDDKRIKIEVVYAEPKRQIINEVQVPDGATIEDGIVLSGILDELPHIELTETRVGIFGAIKPLAEVLRDGDRVEIYRPVNS